MTDDILRRTRRGYYASISYIDRKVANLMKTLRQAGLADDTIVVFASDHGDMMGERGLYYKKTFFEWSVRVPLIFWAPRRFAPGRCSAPVSLLDLMATLHDIAGGDPSEILDTDGLSLSPALTGSGLPDRVIAGEFLAEGVFEPTFMLRDRHHKLLYSETDAPLLFNLTDDPAEQTNLADTPNSLAILKSLQAMAARLWNASEIRAAIIADQNRRRLIDRAHKVGRPPVWDYQPMEDASQKWVRAGKWTVEVEADAHLNLAK